MQTSARLMAFFLSIVFFSFWPAARGLAGNLSWSQEKISSGLSRAQLSVSTYYTPVSLSSAQSGGPGLGSAITQVRVQRDHQARVPVSSQLCWSDLSLCVPMTGATLVTDAFNGRDARGPLVLVHSVPGKGALAQPVFVRASVSVWFTP
jgi:flagellar protein FlhE